MNRFHFAGCLLLGLVAIAMADEPVQPAGFHIANHPWVEPVAPAPGKVCVQECVPTKTTVYGSVVKEYCVKQTCFDRLFHKLCDICGLADDDCPDCAVKTKTVLTKKVVKGPEINRCVLKDAPAGSPVPAVTVPVLPPDAEKLPAPLPRK